jgi:hypothetical protein
VREEPESMPGLPSARRSDSARPAGETYMIMNENKSKDMKKNYRNPMAALLPLLSIVLLSASCGQIKEDRTDCPCWLKLITADAFRPARIATVHLEASAGDSFEENITKEDEGSDEREYSVSRRMVRVCVWSQQRGGAVDGTSIAFTRGQAVDTVWAYSNLVDCRYESAIDTVYMHKQFARVTVLPEGDSWSGMNVGRLDVQTTVGGLDLESLLPLQGDWGESRSVASSGVEKVTFIVPRMTYDDAFTLTVYDRGGGEMDEWDLQAVLTGADYSWTKADLDDITIRLSRTHGEVYAEVQPWNNGRVYDWSSEEF